MTHSSSKTRFAPSPTGLLHLGNVRTALFNFLLARNLHGTFLLRLEDTDAARDQQRFADALQEDLRWLGLQWDEGPGTDGARGPYAQSQRAGIYKEYMARLEQQGLVYPCFCTEQELNVWRKTQLAAGRPPRYSGRCRTLERTEVKARLAQGAPATLRFHVEDGHSVSFDDRLRGPQHFATDDIGDFVIRRSDGTPAFFFCNAVDDALMGVTLVVRGEDHLTNTPRQILLFQALGLPIPEYGHIALVVGPDGAPLSKRTGSRSVQDLRASGYMPLAINNYLARVGHTYEDNRLMTQTELANHFDIARLHRSPARYDEAQLLHWQHEAVRQAKLAELWEWMGKEVQALVPADKSDDFVNSVRANLVFPSDALKWARIIFTDDWVLSEQARAAITTAGADFFIHAVRALDQHPADFKMLTETLKRTTKVSGKALYAPLRAALTGEIDGPEIARLLPLIGTNRARTRFDKVRNNIRSRPA